MWVDQNTQDDWRAGVERRQWLEIALLESLKKHGTGRESYRKVRVRVRPNTCFKSQQQSVSFYIYIYIQMVFVYIYLHMIYIYGS